MKITADTNIFVRAVTDDDPVQSRIAQRTLVEADLVVLTSVALCEFCWVVDRIYGFDRGEIATAVRTLVAGDNVAADRPAIEAGLAMLDVGGDFADGIIAHSGQWLGAETFVSFDRRAVRILTVQGQQATTPE